MAIIGDKVFDKVNIDENEQQGFHTISHNVNVAPYQIKTAKQHRRESIVDVHRENVCRSEGSELRRVEV